MFDLEDIARCQHGDAERARSGAKWRDYKFDVVMKALHRVMDGCFTNRSEDEIPGPGHPPPQDNDIRVEEINEDPNPLPERASGSLKKVDAERVPTLRQLDDQLGVDCVNMSACPFFEPGLGTTFKALTGNSPDGPA